MKFWEVILGVSIKRFGRIFAKSGLGRASLLAAAVLALPAGAMAQTNPDLSGAWVRADGIQYQIVEANAQITVTRAAPFTLNGVAMTSSTVIEQATCSGSSCTGQALTVSNDGSGNTYWDPLTVQISPDGNSVTFTFGGDSTTPPYTLTRQS